MLKLVSTAFTLIELLIVVAIIAILAAIAVPNFLEAQTRAKVTQSFANCRNITTGLESYRVDYNGALPATACNFWWVQRWMFYVGLSTPLPYMSTVPQDPFYCQFGLSSSTYIPDPVARVRYFYEYQILDNNIMKAILKNPTGASAPGIFYWPPASQPGYSYPSGMVSGIKTYFKPMFTTWGKDGAGFAFIGWGPSWDGWFYGGPYDPTNGTISKGNIYYYN